MQDGPATALRRHQRTDQPPFLIRYTNPLAQDHLQKPALNRMSRLTSSFVHDNLDFGVDLRDHALAFIICERARAAGWILDF